MKNLQKLINEITQTTLLIESDYPELYIFLDENPVTIPVGNGEPIDEKSLQNYLESLKQLLIHHIQEHKMSSKINEANSPELKTELSKFSRTVRERTLKRLRQIPDGFINWRLNGSSMSFGDIASHLVHVDELFLTMMEMPEKKYVWVLGTDDPHLSMDQDTFSKLLLRLQNLQTKREKILDFLSESDLRENVRDENGETKSLWWFVMQKLIDHEVYHRGQMSAYLKFLKGEPT